MGILDKVAFWKKNDIGLPPVNQSMGFNDDFNQQQYQPQPYQQQFMPQQNFAPPMMESMQNQQGFRNDRDTELISAKLDAIKAMLENLNQRIANLERIAGGEVDMNTINPRRKW